ncbi:type III pantothenate kinase [Leeia sp. TBRC 13508]|uniref:Type III pantothenate kinase n=1 Tax=Leeia speluncae TaxID=2884804 RepID=A0ABS8D6R9_9NEIS|nr:type III pantothenate kinase [Leeia speluncae]MCB6183893.1 type III pantothenate kinase [Leeia speluncae]
MKIQSPYALLFDIGNTRIKWGMYDLAVGVWHKKGLIEHDELADWLNKYRPILDQATLIKGSNVSTSHFQEKINQSSHHTIEWVVSETARASVINRYDFPNKLGADRWLSLIAARSAHEGNVVVVNAGTAVTIDALDESGAFRGGFIVPGLHLMRQSLAKGTAGLPLQEGGFANYPSNTGNALYTGAVQAIAGAIMQIAHQMLNDGIPPGMCMLSGGDANIIAPHLSLPVTIVEHLVLDGLAVISQHAYSSMGKE